MNSLTDTFFVWLWSTTLHATVLAFVVLILQSVLGHRINATWRMLLWWIVILRLIMPVVPSSPFSIFEFTGDPDDWIARSVHSVDWVGGLDLEQPVLDETMLSPTGDVSRDRSQDTESMTAVNSPPDSRLSGLQIAWLIGAGLLAARILASSLRLSSRICRLRPITDQETLDLLEDCKHAMRVRVPVSVVQTSVVATPALLGVLRPRLLLPDGFLQSFDQSELRCVFIHELAHLKRRDIIVGWITSATLLLHWFNPLVWIMVHRMRSDRELACDTLAMSKLQSDDHPRYGSTIIKLFEQFAPTRRLPGLAGILETRSDLKRRMISIARHRTTPLWHAIATLLLLAILMPLFLTAAPAPAISGLTSPRLIEIGDLAPELTGASLVDGSGGEAVALTEFRDQVVVLLFWATYCHLPIDHLNDLVDEFKDESVTFIAINHQDESDIRAYVKRHGLRFRIAATGNEALHEDYDARIVPQVVVVDRAGIIVAITRCEELTSSAITDVLAGKAIDLPRKTSRLPDINWDDFEGAAPYDAPYIRTGASDADGSSHRVEPGSGRITGDGLLPEVLFQIAYEVKHHLIDWRGPESKQGYRISVFAPDGDDDQARAMIAGAAKSMFGLNTRWENREREVVVLRRANGAPELHPLDPSGLRSFARAGKISSSTVPMATFTDSLESFAFGATVIDATGLEGHYNFELQWIPGDRETLDAALHEAGFVYERQMRVLRILVVESAQEGASTPP